MRQLKYSVSKSSWIKFNLHFCSLKKEYAIEKLVGRDDRWLGYGIVEECAVSPLIDADEPVVANSRFLRWNELYHFS